MSAYSDWKYGDLSDAEYKSICRIEDEKDRARYERETIEDYAKERCERCAYYKEDEECEHGFDPVECLRESN